MEEINEAKQYVKRLRMYILNMLKTELKSTSGSMTETEQEHLWIEKKRGWKETTDCTF